MTQTVLGQMGGEPALKGLVEHVYDLMETSPDTHVLRELHMDGHGFAHTREEQFDFLSGFLGGRQYYLEKHRHMNVREIHAHVPIRTEDAETWLHTWDTALADLALEGPHIERMRQTLRRVALILVNHGEVA